EARKAKIKGPSAVMKKFDLSQDLYARSVMKEVIALIESRWNEIERFRFSVSYKEDGSPVTEADTLIESVIRNHLSMLLPDLTFVGEESFNQPVSLRSGGYHAILDPIDGTENFCSGLKEWGIALTLWHGPNHLGSLLYMPELGEHLMTGDK